MQITGRRARMSIVIIVLPSHLCLILQRPVWPQSHQDMGSEWWLFFGPWSAHGLTHCCFSILLDPVQSTPCVSHAVLFSPSWLALTSLWPWTLQLSPIWSSYLYFLLLWNQPRIIFFSFVYLAASGHSCDKWDHSCIMQDFSLRCMGLVVP